MQLPKYEELDSWQFGPWLVKATADYYLTMDTYLYLEDVSRRRAGVYEREWREIAYEMANEMCRYLILACGGELRHHHLWPSIGHREQMWGMVSGWLSGRPHDFLAEVMDKWAALFIGGGFGGAMGGKPWSQACALVAAWLRKDYSDVMFVELALNLHHNCAIIFNKRPLDNGAYLKLLEAGHDGLQIDSNADQFLKYGSIGRGETWRNEVRGHRKAQARLAAETGVAPSTPTQVTSPTNQEPSSSPPPNPPAEKVW